MPGNTTADGSGGFAGFSTSYIDCPSGARVFAYIRAEGDANLPVLVLLHGFPQNALMFKHFVRLLPANWRVFVPDLPGYGNSTKLVPPSEPGLAHSKRAWATDILHAASAQFGEGCPVVIVGHDRGARVAYRAALDHSERVRGAALLDIVPTSHVWGNMSLEKRAHLETFRSSHWIFLASPRPVPETLIAGNPKFYFEHLFNRWTPPGVVGPPEDPRSSSKVESNEALMPDWVRDSIAQYLDSERGYDRIVAACEDYRAGATHDVQDDFASSINPLSPPPPSISPAFTCPLLVLSCAGLRSRFSVDQLWMSLGAPGKVRSVQIGDERVGHFLVNEAPEKTSEEINAWLKEWFEEKKAGA